MLRRWHRAALAAAAFAFAGCPGSRGGQPPDRFVPAAVPAAVVVPETARAARELADLHATLSGFPGAAELAGFRAALGEQLGFDPLDPEALSDAGLDPRRGAAFALLDGDGAAARKALLVLPARDPSRLEALFLRLARDRLGATERSSERRGRATIVVLRRPGAPAPALAWAIVERTALLCAGPGGPEAVARAAALDPAEALARSPAWKAAGDALDPSPAVVLFVPAGSPFLEGMWAVKDGLAVGLSATPARLTAHAAVLLGAREPSFRSLAPSEPGEGARAVARLDPAAQLVARFDGDFAALGEKVVPMLRAGERERLAARGLEPRALFDLLAPGGVLSLSLAPELEVSGLDARAARNDPLRAVEFEAILPVKDPGAAESASRLLAGRGHAAEDEPAKDEPAGGTRGGAYAIRTPSGEIAWRVDRAERRVVAAGGRPDRLAALEARLAAGGPGWRAPTERAGAALAGGLGGAALDVPRLVEAVRGLPDEAFGTGPSAFVLRSLVDRLVEPAARLSAVSFRADLAPGALVLSLDVEARAAGEARP